ncbi:MULTISPECIES: hypothetical protein [Streptomyces]|uniref:hypothetical protein n=1 Tax=Streptomyces TaxID=1883 RepID=UPI0015F8B073|nr:hypothetical protein [Streptomyces sp. GMR22]MBA6439917.1 hypothetical protein [Streptomyces sp. GMR22]
MADNVSRTISTASASPDAIPPLAALVGREFVEALGAGLRRARAGHPGGTHTASRPYQRIAPEPPDAAPGEPEPGATRPTPAHTGTRAVVPRREPTPEHLAALAMTLLGEHAAAILRDFETALPLVMRQRAGAGRVSRLWLVGWAGAALRAALRRGAGARTTARPPAADQQVIAAALLLECAAAALPAGHPAASEAVRILARAIRTLPAGPVAPLGTTG